MTNLIIDIESTDWMPAFEGCLGDLVTPSIKFELQQASFQYWDDALESLAVSTDINAVIDVTLEFIKGNRVRIYHGTRLTDEEANSLRAEGLKPLVISERVQWLQAQSPELRRALSPEVVASAINKGSLEVRENQVHAAICRAEMFKGYNYLFEGSEFDRRLLAYADRSDLIPLLQQRGKPRLVSLAIPGQLALDAMHVFTTVEMARSADTYPILVRQMLEAYAWKLHQPSSAPYSVDACLVFREAVPGEFIEAVQEIKPL